MISRLLAFCLGALLASTPLNWVFLLMPFALIYLCVFYQRFFLVCLFLVAGFSWVLFNLSLAQSNAIPISTGPFKAMATGLVSNVSVSDQKRAFDFNLSDEGLHYGGGDPKSGKLKVRCYRCGINVQNGDTWQLDLRVRPVVSLNNVNGFDYRQWMSTKGYIATATVDSRSKTNYLIKQGGFRLKAEVSRVLPKSQMPILRALLLGDKSAMNVQDLRLINQAGISHLFVVSGLHISLLALMVMMVISWLQRPLLVFYWSRGVFVSAFIALCIATAYAYVSGFNIPALRALFMLMCSLLMLWGHRNTLAIYYWLVALTLLLLIHPLALFDMGSWLSFGIVFALIVGLSGVINSPFALTGASRVSGFPGLRMAAIARFLKSILTAQWLAFCVGGAILTVFHFPVSGASLVFNFFLIPFIGLVFVPMAFAGVMLGFLDSPSLLVFCEWLMTSILAVLQQFESMITLTTLPIHDENRSLMLMVFFLLVLPRALGFLPLAGVLIGVSLLGPVSTPEKGGFTLIMLDVGQGSSAVIQTRAHSMVIDTGYGHPERMGMADYVVKPYLQQKNIKKLDRLFLTHDDTDHSGGFDLLNPMSVAVTRQNDCEYKHWVWDDVRFQQFQSPDDTRGNNGTCLVKITARDGPSVLFTGDVEKKAETALLEYYPRLLKSDVIIVPHHGSKTSSSSAFLTAVAPEIALISAGSMNHFGHPHPEVVNRYRARLVKIYSTASHGAIEVEFSPRQAARIVSTYRPNNVTE
jgi:competence protein ComEC